MTLLRAIFGGCLVMAVSLTADANEELFAACATCHGNQAQGNDQLSSPRLAGQNAPYLAEQLRNYRAGARGWHPDDTQGQVMAASAMALTDEEIESISAYLAGIGDPTELPDPDLSPAGRDLYDNNCMVCHGVTGAGVAPLYVPNLRILSERYLMDQLSAYVKGWRGDEMHGTTRAKGMRAIAAQLNGIAEMQALAKHLAADL